MKAVIITKNNQSFLASRYGIEDVDLNEQLPTDYILVTDFGNDEKFDVLTKTKFSLLFEATGVKIANEFFEIKQR